MLQNSNDDVLEIDVEVFQQKLNSSDNFVLIDVREPHEYNICNFEKAQLIPLSELEANLDSLEKDADYIIHCKHGSRSYRAAKLMKNNGFVNVINLAGGIMDWAKRIDPSMKEY